MLLAKRPRLRLYVLRRDWTLSAFFGIPSAHEYRVFLPPSIKFDRRVSKAMMSRSTARTPCQPASVRPSDRPPQPANKSMNRCLPTYGVSSHFKPTYGLLCVAGEIRHQ